MSTYISEARGALKVLGLEDDIIVVDNSEDAIPLIAREMGDRGTNS